MTFDIAENIRRHGFKRLLLAVSGGLDSICLAHYFIENREALGIEWLGIAHVHHGLREGTADRDAAFVEAFAKSHDVPFFLKKLDGEALKAAEGSLEENARDARYKALVEVVKSIVTQEACKVDRVHNSSFMDPIASLQDDTIRSKAGMTSRDGNSHVSNLAIVTAHHAGDQAETMLMRLKRGTTLAGLRGIQELRALDSLVTLEACKADNDKSSRSYRSQGSLQDDKPLLYIYRPFLNVTRAELLEYAREHNLTWCEDESNSDVKFARNSIRHQLLPHLENEVPGATKQLCTIAELADKTYEKVMRKCENVFGAVLCTDIEERRSPNKSRIKVANGCVTGSYQSQGPLQDDTIRTKAEITSAAVSYIALDKKKLNKILSAHRDVDLSEMFRLWLSEQGFRFPISFFYAPKEPAHVKIPSRTVYRKRSIVKIRHTVWICEFKDALSAAKFVSCEMKEKDYNEST